MRDSRLPIGAYVPCYNNAATVRQTVNSLLQQSLRPAEVLVVDDGSSDQSMSRLAGLPVRVLRHEVNLGRGAVRNTAMREMREDIVVCCDATNALDEFFIEKAVAFFDDPAVAAVFGRFSQSDGETATLRWRARHLYRMDVSRTLQRRASLSTHGTLVSRSWVAKVGGFDANLRHGEDGELGQRLLAADANVIFDPSLVVMSLTDNSPLHLLERYWRWNAGVDERASWPAYWRNFVYSVRSMVWKDLRARDPRAALISLFCPHFQFWKSWMRAMGRTLKK